MKNKRVKSISPPELKRYMSSHSEQNYSLIDVRFPEEYEDEHIPGAQHIPLPKIEEKLKEINPDKNLIFYCLSGKRALAAATLVVDKSEFSKTDIYNLQGGILGWKGKTIAEYPRIKVFEAIGELKDIMFKAIDMEKGTWKFYTSMLEEFPDHEFVNSIKEIAETEIKHAKSVYALLKRSYPEIKPFELLFQELPGNIVEGGQEIKELVNKIKEIGQQGCILLAETALDIEYHAYDLYRTMAHKVQDEKIEHTFLYLSEQEKGHIRILAKGLSSCSG